MERALKCGINHIETAHGYKKSEHVLGVVLNDLLKVNRERYFLMTKGDAPTAEKMRQMVEKQLEVLKTDYFDFYAWHGINNQAIADIALKKNGPVEELLKLKEEGIIKHVGFSTHAPLEVVINAIQTNYFEFINLHYYYFFQRLYGAIALAQSKDMGVFIISPNDKGGKLYNAPEKLKQLTAPLTPIQFNARFCLQNPAIHTLSFGMTEGTHFDEMMGIFPFSVPLSKEDREIVERMDNQRKEDPYAYYDGYDLQNDPSGINIPEVLRMRMMWKCYDMLEFGKFRYNLMSEDHHWFPGRFASQENLGKINMENVPSNIPLKDMLLETHNAFYKLKVKLD